MNAQQLKNSILQEAIEGRLVPQDPNDEPASVLLDIIRAEKKRLVKEGKLKKKDLEETPISEDEIPFEIPDSWEWVRIKDVFIINPKVIADDNADAAFIPMEKIEACYGSRFSYEIRKWKTIKSSFTCFADGDVAFAKITPCFQNRKSMILKDLPNGIGAGTTELKVLRQYAETIEREYLLYFLASSYFIDEATFKGTANQQRIIVGYLENKMFPLPPLAEQKRIVAKIEELLPKVEEYGKAQDALNKLNEELPERLKKSILQEAISGRLVPQDPNDEPASVLLDKIRKEKAQLVKEGKLKKKDLEETPISEDEKPFEIPESWEWVRLGSLISYQNGYAYNSSEMNKEGKGVPVIKSGNLMTLEVVIKPNNDYIEYPTEKMLSSKIVKGDMLMCLSSQSDNPEPLGKTAIFKLDSYALLNQRVLKIRPYKDELTPYLYYTINSFYFWFNVSHQGGGSAQANLKLNHVLDMPIPLPPLAEQKRIVAKIEEVFKEIDKLKK